ncbi:MAG: RNA 3'-terminal phosphate cyclase [Thermoplasmata archaeon]|nr:RNA 3'-terminal phosphate cyclase [Thermoplasmata archaeon]
MIEIDGSWGEGGGQILRASLSLATLRGVSVRIRNIRASRPNPGLAPQHLAVLKAFKEIFSGSLQGAYIGSKTVVFTPGEVRGGRYVVDIGTAGSTTLLAHALLPALLRSERDVQVILRGGTDTRWAPTWIHFSEVFLYTLRRAGYSVEAEVRRRGFYPRGRGEIVVSVDPPHSPRPLSITSPGEVKEVGIYSYTQGIGRDVAKRMASSAEEFFKGFNVRSVVEEGRGVSPGAVIDVVVETSGGCRLGSNALGERGKPAEVVGREAAERIMEELNPIRCADRHLQDQLIIYMALGGGEILTGPLTSHTRTQIWLAGKFIEGLDFKLEEMGELTKISTRGGSILSS